MGRRFEIDDSITADIKSAATDSFKDNIKMIEVNKIKMSVDNFYTIEDIETLADDIERQGLKHNLVVAEDSENPDTYFIKSGHRRYTAIKQLIAENRYGSKYIPCLIDGVKSHSETLLDLIMLNATTRVMSDSEMYKQYETLKYTLEKLKSEGVKIKGRLREKVAEMLKVSPAQIGKIENIKHNAVDEIKEAVENGDMSITTADSIAKMSEQEQKSLIAEKDISEISKKDVVKHKKNKSDTKNDKSVKAEETKTENEFDTASLTDDNIEFEIADNDEIIEDVNDDKSIDEYRSTLLDMSADFEIKINSTNSSDELKKAITDMIEKLSKLQTEV